MWSVKCEVWSVKRGESSVQREVRHVILAAQSVAWHCASHVLGQQQCNRFAPKHARTGLADAGRMQVPKMKRSYNMTLTQLPPRRVWVLLVW